MLAYPITRVNRRRKKTSDELFVAFCELPDDAVTAREDTSLQKGVTRPKSTRSPTNSHGNSEQLRISRKRVQRGGSFLCSDAYCTRYVPGGRGKGEPSSAASHVGFRCVRSAKP